MSDNSTGEKLYYCKVCHHGPLTRTTRFCPSPTCRQPTAGNLRPWPPPEHQAEAAPPTRPHATTATTEGGTNTIEPPQGRTHPQATRRDTGLALRFPFGDIPIGRELNIGREPTYSKIAEQLASWDNVSREHAVITVQDGCCTIRDLGSSNGTWVNEVKLGYDEPVPLAAGDRVRFAARLVAEVVEVIVP